jgi:hypothetical protein
MAQVVGLSLTGQQVNEVTSCFVVPSVTNSSVRSNSTRTDLRSHPSYCSTAVIGPRTLPLLCRSALDLKQRAIAQALSKRAVIPS